MAVNIQEIDSLLETDRFAEGVSAIKALAGELLKCGKYSPLLSLISRIPVSLRTSDDDLSLIFAECLIHTGELHQAGAVLTRIIDTNAENAAGSPVSVKALIWRSAAHRLAGNLQNAITDAKSALFRLKGGDNLPLIASAQFRLGNAFFYLGDLNKATKHLKLAASSSSDSFDLDLIARIQNSLGAAYLRRGDLTLAATHFEYACEGWEKTENFGSLAATQNNLAYFYQRQGQPKPALEMLSTALRNARSANSKRIEANILTAIGVAQRDSGDFDASIGTLNSALVVARDAMEKYYVSWAKAELGDTYRRKGHYSRAVQLLTEAIGQANEQLQTTDADIFSVLLGISQFMDGDEKMGLDLLSCTAQKLEAGGDQDALVRCYFFLAHCVFSLKDFESTTAYLEKTSAMAEKLGYDGFLSIEGQDFPLLIHFAASKRIGDDRFVRAQRQINENTKHRTDERSGPDTEIGRVGVEGYSLGKTKAWIFSKIVDESEWRSLRAKELFFYLLCYPNQTGEQITSALWPEIPPDRALSNFHTALYRARRATSPSVITLNGGRYQINESLKVYFDASDFLNLSKPKHPTETREVYFERLEQAVNLYQGPFMDGFQGEWIDILRQDYEAKYLRALTALAHNYRKQGEHQKAISLLEKAVAIDIYHDDLYCDIIESYIAQGDRLSALRTYQRYESTVTKEMASELPTRLTQLLKPLTT